MAQKTALISVYDKTDLLPFAQTLQKHGYRILSTGGSASYLKENGIEVVQVDEISQFPEILEGRVKTLHPKIHAGILADRDKAQHLSQLAEHHIDTIDMVVVNLYPFFEKLSQNLPQNELIEFIDIGGPCMLRAAAKNFKHTTSVCCVQDYKKIAQELENQGEITFETRQELAGKVFNLCSAYDGAIASFLSRATYPDYLQVSYRKNMELRYGENPHQSASFYQDNTQSGVFSDFEQLSGKQLSFNNFRDMDLAWRVVGEFANEWVCCAVKHSTPCGVGIGENLEQAYLRAHSCDPVSIFGGIIALNGVVEQSLAEHLSQTFLEIVMAKDFSAEAVKILSEKKNLRLIKIKNHAKDPYSYVKIDGGMLVQQSDLQFSKEIQTVTKLAPNQGQMQALLFAQRVVKFVKSNAIVVADKHRALGIAAGQVNRIWAAEQAISRALEKNPNAAELVLASDAFFPFPDVVELCASKGIKAIIQPGGSLKDEASISCANQHGISMVFTGMRHFLH